MYSGKLTALTNPFCKPNSERPVQESLLALLGLQKRVVLLFLSSGFVFPAKDVSFLTHTNKQNTHHPMMYLKLFFLNNHLFLRTLPTDLFSHEDSYYPLSGSCAYSALCQPFGKKYLLDLFVVFMKGVCSLK